DPGHDRSGDGGAVDPDGLRISGGAESGRDVDRGSDVVEATGRCLVLHHLAGGDTDTGQAVGDDLLGVLGVEHLLDLDGRADGFGRVVAVEDGEDAVAQVLHHLAAVLDGRSGGYC